jgi:hypothetical protein
LLRQLIPKLVVKPYRLCDGGHPVLRAHVTLSVAPLLPGELPTSLTGALQRSLIVDLFEPPQREQFRARVVQLTSKGLQQRDIAEELGISQAAVQDALALGRRMKQLGIVDPYVPLAAPPDDYRKLRRHRHPRYRFQPLVPETPPSE